MNDIIRRGILGHGVQKCIYCGEAHETICPDIKAIEWNAEGDPVRVELLTPNDRPQEICGPLGEIKFFEGR